MTYDRNEGLAVIAGFEIWFDEVTGANAYEMIDDILPQVLASGQHGLHEYNGISTDWRFTHTGRGYF